MKLVVASYQCAALLPPLERYGLAAQIRSASRSIAANIGEASGRRSRGDYGRFSSIARGSARELDTHLEIAVMLNYLDESQVRNVRSLLDEVTRMLSAILRKVEPLRPPTSYLRPRRT